MSKWFWVSSSVILLSCEGLTLETSPEADFELMFEYLKKDYAYRDAHSFTMDELRDKYIDRITNNPSQETLAEIFLNIERNELKDPHVYFKDDTLLLLDALANVAETDPVSLDETVPLFNEVTLFSDENFYAHGALKSEPSIGYLYIRNYNESVGGTSSLGIAEGVNRIEDIINDFNNIGFTSLIIDIRSSAGGSAYIPRLLAEYFANFSGTYMIEEYPTEDGFERKEWSLSPNSHQGFRNGKIALLTNGLTCSGGEIFVLAMLVRNNLVHIGSKTNGCTGNIADKDFSNGWNFRITNSRTEMPDGTQYFKVGIKPSIVVENESSYGVSTFEDKVIQRAVEELKK